jgi:predicted Zn-dependent protease
VTRRTRRLALAGTLSVAAAGVALAAAPVAWEDLSEADWLYPLATRFADLDGHRVHYPTPTVELVPLLEARSESAARRQLADARLALGDRAGAVAAITSWAEAEGPPAWAEAARWAAQQGESAFAFRAAERALPALEDEEKATLAAERVAWADAHPELADPIELRAERARLVPGDAAAAEDWLRALEKAGRVDEALAGVERATALTPERRLLLRSDLAADHGQAGRAFDLLDAALDGAGSWPIELKRAFAQRTVAARPALPESWRATLESGFDPSALVRLATLFQGQERGDQAAELLRQVQRRHETRLDRGGWLLLARLHGEIDAVPEAFRARLAAAAGAGAAQQADDLAALARLALRAGSRPLGWGAYNDEPYRWAARVDRTPGFWTGGVAFLLTGGDWRQALARLESDSVAERTFATARALVAELALRQPAHGELAALRAALMSRHVERGEGKEALALLPQVEGGAAAAVAEARRAALLAMRQVETALSVETPLWRSRLAALAPDGSRPETSRGGRYGRESAWSAPAGGSAWTRTLASEPAERYRDVLDEAIARLEQRDPSHRAAVGLMLGEMDRLPRAEGLWLELADRLDSWNLDDEIGPRYERALERFSDAGWWARVARWSARRSRQQELDRLAQDLTARFRASAIFERAPLDDRVRIAVPEAARAGVRVPLVSWADWVRVRALQRFPHSPLVYRQALGRLKDVVDPALLEERGWAVLFADEPRRDAYLAEAMRHGTLAASLASWEARPQRTPVDELLIFEGRARLSQFEKAQGAAARLAALYPGDGVLARRVLSLERSLSALDPAQAAAAAALVARTAPALADPAPLWTELGELEHDAGRPDRAKQAWRHVLERSPRDPQRVGELATLLWDYGELDDALATIEDARRRLARPGLLAFEAGVLREEKRDLDGAIREYLQAGLPEEEGDCFCSAFERDQRSLRRLAQLVGRERVRRTLLARLTALQPGVAADEDTLVAFYPLATIRMPDADLDWTVDDWIDALDHPVDPVAREERRDARESWREATRDGQAKVAAALLSRTRALVAAGTRPGFLDAVERWTRPLLEAQPTRTDEVTLRAEVMARRAVLAATPEERVTREIARAGYLFANGRRTEADAAWKAVSERVATLPEGAPRMRAESQRAAHLERSQGADAAAAEWERLAARYPWSLGMLEDRLAFLDRVGRDALGRELLEQAAARAASGQREALLERLARDAVAKDDLGRAQRAVEGLLAAAQTDDARRLAAAHLLARLALRRDAQSDLVAIAKREEPRLQPDSRAELFAQLARAAALESAWKPSLTLWIEALNRRLDRGWLREACRAAERGGAGETLLSFFERQRARSPRDVRWAVALRELRLYFGDSDGALEAARAAIAVRPDRESLWFEAADLLARLGRPREGAQLLAEWVKTRPADERAAGRRLALLAAAGDAQGALAVERAALAAYPGARAADEERARELAARRGCAVRRLLELGLPGQAYALLSPAGTSRLAETDLGAAGEAEVALAAGRFLPLLRRRIADEEFRGAAAPVLSERGRPEQKEEVLAWLAGEILPGAAGATRRALGLAQAWPFAQQAGLGEALRVELARRILAARPGPWGTTPPESFVDDVAALVVDESHGAPALATPPFDRTWVKDLVARDHAEDLWTFLAPRWEALLAEVRSASRVDPKVVYRDWRSWLDRDTLALWAAGARRDPARVAEVASVMTERRLWDRLWALGARQWDVSPLIALLPDDARARWFRMWLSPSPADRDPALRARGGALEQATLALGRLVAGREGAAADPVIGALRGARTVGAALDERGRPSRDLWGERPGPAWLVLEALARMRAKDPEASLVPLEASDRSGETLRARLGARLAEANGDAPQALRLLEDVPSPDTTDLERRVRLLQGSQRGDEATESFRTEVRRLQPRLDEAAFRRLARVAADLGLPDPASLLERTIAVPGPFLAFLCDVRGLEACHGLAPVGPADFRTALAARWQQRQRALSAEETRFALAELWANEAGPLPRSGLRRLGPLWPRAATWLESVRPGERREAISALLALPDDGPLAALLAREPALSPEAWLLRLRVRLLRGEDAQARQMLLDRVAASEKDGGLTFSPVTVPTGGSELEAEDGGAETDVHADETTQGAYEPADPLVAGLRSWLAPFREASRLGLVEDPAREALLRRAVANPRAAAAWALALDLAGTPDARRSVQAEIERAWRLGDLDAGSLAPIVAAAGRGSPAEADRWLARLATGPGIDSASARARLLAGLGRRPEAARFLSEARSTGAWTAADETKAFDLWRAFAPAAAATSDARETGAAPSAWAAARPFWTRPAAQITADLAAHLRAHPLDVRAARAALRTAAAADADAMALAARALRQGEGDSGTDVPLLQLRAARAWLPSSPAAARNALGARNPGLARELERRRLPASEVRSALEDVARMLTVPSDTAATAGAAAGAEAALAALEDRDPAASGTLRAELRRLASPVAARPYRLANGRPEPWRPMDLDWPALRTVLDAEGAR